VQVAPVAGAGLSEQVAKEWHGFEPTAQPLMSAKKEKPVLQEASHDAAIAEKHAESFFWCSQQV
jgi:hypothetical protein